jgi:hypothetical protein
VAPPDASTRSKAALAAQHLHLAAPRQAGEAVGQARDDALLEGADLREVERGLAEGDAVGGERAGLAHDLGQVQQRLRRDAADVEAHAPEALVPLDQHHLLAEVRRAEGGRVAAGARAQHQHLAAQVGGGQVGGGRGGGRAGSGGRPRRARARLLHRREAQDQVALRHARADGDGELGDAARVRARDLHGRLVALQRDQRLLRFHAVADGDEDLDHVDVLEVADVGHPDVEEPAHSSRFRMSDSTCFRRVVKRTASAPSITRWS